MTYSDKLKHPKWQKKRLEILSRDKFTCRGCGSKDHTLHVHHFTYQKGKLPWEYENSNFITLCDLCHFQEEQIIRDDNKYFISLSRLYKTPIRTMYFRNTALLYFELNDKKLFNRIRKAINNGIDKHQVGYVSFLSELFDNIDNGNK